MEKQREEPHAHTQLPRIPSPGTSGGPAPALLSILLLHPPSTRSLLENSREKTEPQGLPAGDQCGAGGDTGAAKGPGLHRCPRGFGPSRMAAASSLRHVDAPLGGKQCVYCKGFCRLVTREGEFQALPRGNGGPNTEGLWAFPRGPRLQVAAMLLKKPPGSGPKRADGLVCSFAVCPFTRSDIF